MRGLLCETRCAFDSVIRLADLAERKEREAEEEKDAKRLRMSRPNKWPAQTYDDDFSDNDWTWPWPQSHDVVSEYPPEDFPWNYRGDGSGGPGSSR